MLTVVDGTIELKDQLRDYKFRGEELTSMNFLEFMLETYEDSKDNIEVESVIGPPNADNTPKPRGPGRPLSTRIPYQIEAGKGKRCRIKRLQEHETLPRIIGKWFSRSDNVHERELFMASMLLLLKPWRDIQNLKGAAETFENAYSKLLSQSDDKVKRVVANVQYYFECSDGAKEDRKKMIAQAGQAIPNNDGLDININNGDDIKDNGNGADCVTEEITEEDIERAQTMKTHARERLYGEAAVALGYDFGFFEDIEARNGYPITARKMCPEEGGNIRTWEAQLKATTREQIDIFRTTDTIDRPNEAESFTLLHESYPDISLRREQSSTGQSVSTERTELAKLNDDQRRAHDIVEERLKEHITSELLKERIRTKLIRPKRTDRPTSSGCFYLEEVGQGKPQLSAQLQKPLNITANSTYWQNVPQQESLQSKLEPLPSTPGQPYPSICRKTTIGLTGLRK